MKTKRKTQLNSISNLLLSFKRARSSSSVSASGGRVMSKRVSLVKASLGITAAPENEMGFSFNIFQADSKFFGVSNQTSRRVMRRFLCGVTPKKNGE